MSIKSDIYERRIFFYYCWLNFASMFASVSMLNWINGKEIHNLSQWKKQIKKIKRNVSLLLPPIALRMSNFQINLTFWKNMKAWKKSVRKFRKNKPFALRLFFLIKTWVVILTGIRCLRLGAHNKFYTLIPYRARRSVDHTI